MKKNFKFITIFIMLVLILIIFQSNVFARLSTSSAADPNSNLTGLNNIIQKIAEFGMSASLSSLATLTTGLAILLLLLMATIFSTAGITTDTLVSYPFPDFVIFNKIALFDPNFTNPAAGSFTEAIRTTILSFFNSFQALGIAVLVIAAMLMGIKFAMSTIATEKAKYKEGLSKWVMGIIILIMLRYIIGGVFALNETFLDGIGDSTDSISFEVNVVAAIPFYGNILGKILEATRNNIFSNIRRTRIFWVCITKCSKGYRRRYYRWNFGLCYNRTKYSSYNNVLKKSILLCSFRINCTYDSCSRHYK